MDTTPIISGSTGFDILEGEYLEVTVNSKTYSSQTGAVVIDFDNNTWYVQIPDSDALPIGTYNVSAVLKNAEGEITQDDTTNELVVSPSPTINFTATAATSDDTGTALTISENGTWRILSNSTVFTQNATDPSTLGSFTSIAISGADRQQQSSFIDFDRDGLMDILGADTSFANGQQSFKYNADGTYTVFQIGSFGISGQTNDANGNTYVWYGGVAGIDINGDGYVDIVYGDETPNDAETRGGYDTTFVLNTNGTILGFNKSGAYVYTQTNQDGVAATNSGNPTPDREIAGVDLNNDGYVDIVYHGTAGTNTTSTGGSSGVSTRLVVVNNGVDANGNTTLTNTQIVTDVFNGDNGTTNVYTSLTWADFNGDGYMDLFIGGLTGTGTAANSEIYYNDGTGKLVTTTNGVGTGTNVQTLTDATNSNTSLAVDWNGDGKIDIIEIAGISQGNSAANVSSADNKGILWLNGGTNASGQVNWTSETILAQANIRPGAASTYRFVSGAQVVDLDYDGDQDLVVFRSEAGATSYIENKSVIQDGTSIILNIRDKNGINAYYGNTVALIDEATGQVVATQIINAQSGVNTQNSTGLVYFYGLDASKSYSAVILSNGNDYGGISSITLGSSVNTIENVNETWAGLKAVEKNHAYVLTTENGTAASSTATAATDGTNTVGILGTGYNDTLYATAGTHVYNGAGGSELVSGVNTWSDTGGMDIVDYKLAGSTAITVDLSITTAQNTGFGTATFVNIEGIAGSSSNDTFTDNAGNNQFEGRGGNDIFNLINGGNDTLLYKVLDAANATGGNGSDVVNGFHVGTWEATPNADRIDLSELLIGYTGSVTPASYINGTPTLAADAEIRNYLSVQSDGTNTTISIDRDGAGGAYSSTTLVTLNDVDTTLEKLLANHQIIIG
ncbi:hypothetical protein CAP51_11110 [Acinetobacter populi]|uniref:Bacterial Ig-like domain-containing protein n=1 Tax=Acinetobacter populi TaxID=1582270 RepID=A0A1Z9YYD9_9GAMM|nr:hypothetical protein CAP51_11110 [Acinetobacter populi]